MKLPSATTAWRTLLWGSVFAAMGYWLLWVLACPVLNADSLTFNLARLWVLERGGLLHNTACTWDRFLTAPLAFDAAHYPFLYLGHAYELPSFLCFIGLLAAAYYLLRERFGENAGLLACLGLLGMPVMVYQAANTKNDLVVAFGLIVWFYAIDRARRATEARGNRLHLVMAALALGLIMGREIQRCSVRAGGRRRDVRRPARPGPTGAGRGFRRGVGGHRAAFQRLGNLRGQPPSLRQLAR